MKKVYEALEKVHGGAEIIEMLKEELKVYNDLDAKSRLTEKKIDKLTKEIGDLEKIKAKLDDAGIDIDDLDKLKTAGAEKTDMEKTLSKLQKQMEALNQTVMQERTEKESISKQARLDKLRTEVSSDLSGVFGKFGGVLADNLVSKGAFKYDENGVVIYETAEGIYQKQQALDILKKEYAENLLPSGRGSGLPPSRSQGGYNTPNIDIDKMSPSEIFRMELEKSLTK